MNFILDYMYSWGGRGFVLKPYDFRSSDARQIHTRFEKTYRQYCPYCGHKVTEVFSLKNENYFDEIAIETDCFDEAKYHNCYGCLNCGWWYYERNDYDYYCVPGHQIRDMASLREFDTNSFQVPIDALKFELLKRPSIVYGIHHKKFEELVADVLKDFLGVEISIVGRRGDGGIDLVYIEGDNPFAVQVKRRQHPEKVETVLPVREFLGAMIIEDFKYGSIVTTAHRFSNGAKNLKKKVEMKRIVNKFELIDAKRFFEMFRFNQKDRAKYPWELLFLDLLEDWDTGPWHKDARHSMDYIGFPNLNIK